jgi:zinc transport system substrate-binding protein
VLAHAVSHAAAARGYAILRTRPTSTRIRRTNVFINLLFPCVEIEAGGIGPAVLAATYRPLASLAVCRAAHIDYRMLRNRVRLERAAWVVGLALVFAACERDPGGAAPDVLFIVVPVSPIAGIVDALAPEGLVETVVLVPPGANPATYQPSIRALRRTATARLYLEMGHPAFVFEKTWLDGALDGSSADRVPLFEGCPVRDEDPHAWLSTRCLAAAATITASAISGILPAYSEEIAANLASFIARLAATEESAARQLALHRGRMFFVLHPAWGYLARDYDLQQVEILSHGTGDPGAARIAELIRLGRAQGVRTVFVQPQFNPVPAKLVADELGARVLTLDPLARDPVAVITDAVSALAAEFGRQAAE